MPRKMRSLERAAVKSLTLLRSFLPAPPTPLARSLVSLGSEVSRFRWRNRAGVGEGFQTPAPDCGGGPSGSPARVLGGCSDSGRKWLDLAQVTAGRGRGPRGSLALLSLLCVGCGLFFLSCQPTDRDKGWTNNHINKVTRAERGAVGEEDATPFCSDSSVVLVSLLKSSPTPRRIPEAPASSSGLWRAFFNAGPTLRRPFACAVLPPGAPFLCSLPRLPQVSVQIPLPRRGLSGLFSLSSRTPFTPSSLFLLHSQCVSTTGTEFVSILSTARTSELSTVPGA